MADGQAVAFAGAGASAPIYPVWRPFIDQLIDAFEARGEDPTRLGQLRAQTDKPLYVAEELRRLNEPEFHSQVSAAFGTDRPRPLQTQVHERLMRLPFAAYVTTNYDFGLEEARRIVCPDLASYHDMSGHQPEAQDRWQGAQGAAFRSGLKEVLHLHGRFNERNSIILTLEQYRVAYLTTLGRLLQSIWDRQGVVLVGYGFADPWISHVTHAALSGLVGQTRHLAFIGVRDGEPDDARYYESMFGVRPIFYRVRAGDDHSDLAGLIDELDLYDNRPGRDGRAKAAECHVTDFPERRVHQTTDDSHYTGRHEELRRLDAFAASDEVRVVAVTGVGGAGKTSLLGRWLKQPTALRQRGVRGLFVWSFYENRSFAELSKALLQFGEEQFGWSPPRDFDAGGSSIANLLVRLCRDVPLCLLLDGLEVVQGDHNDERHGMFLDQELGEFLASLARQQVGLTLLTSRFSFADLNRFRGLGFAEMLLPRLSPTEGADLLRRLDVVGETEDLIAASTALQGHALALRVLAASARRQKGALPDVSRLPDILGADQFSMKMNRLLNFYREKLSEAEKQVAGLVALFPNAVSTRILRALANRPEYEELARDGTLSSALLALEADGLLLREPGLETWSAHPVVRDYFRPQGGGVAQDAANLIAGRPLSDLPADIEELRGVLDAICILCDAKLYQAAWTLYVSRCSGGEVFFRLGATRRRCEVESRFVTEEARSHLSQEAFARALNNAAAGRARLGDLPGAVAMHDQLAKADAAERRWAAAARRYASKSSLLAEFQPLSEALAQAERAYEFAERSDLDVAVVTASARRGRRLAEAGRAAEAVTFVSSAYRLACQNEEAFLSAKHPFRFDCAQTALSLGRRDLATALFLEDAVVSANDGYPRYAALAQTLAAAANGEHGRCIELATAMQEQARRSGDVFSMAQHMICCADAILETGDAARSEAIARRAVELAGSRGFVRLHAAALASRGAALALEGRLSQARTAAEDSLAIVRPLGYQPDERKAWLTLRRVAESESNDELLTRAQSEIERLSSNLTWPERGEFPSLGLASWSPAHRPAEEGIAETVSLEALLSDLGEDEVELET